MSVHIDLGSLTTTEGTNPVNIEDTVDSIIEQVCETIPAYVRSYTYTDNEQKGFYPYLKNIVTYLLQGLNALFDLKINMCNSEFFTLFVAQSSQGSWEKLTDKILICCQKAIEVLGVTDSDYSSLYVEGEDSEKNTRDLRMQYLLARYTSEVNKRMFDGTISSYLSLISSAIPGSTIQIIDYGITNNSGTEEADKMDIYVYVDSEQSDLFTQMNVDQLRIILTPDILGVNTNIDVADINTLYWDYKEVANEAGQIKPDTDYADWDERNWVGEY